MEPTRQQIIDDVIRSAHEAGSEITSEVAGRIVSDLHDLEGSGHAWIADYIDDLAGKGAAKVYADWRRRYTIDARTTKGTPLELPAFAAAKRRDEDGQVVYTQMRLLDMTLPQLQERRSRMRKTRDTLSAEIRLVSDLIDAMEADPSLITAGDALARIEAA